jgi:hypothetical protein
MSSFFCYKSPVFRVVWDLVYLNREKGDDTLSDQFEIDLVPNLDDTEKKSALTLKPWI